MAVSGEAPVVKGKFKVVVEKCAPGEECLAGCVVIGDEQDICARGVAISWFGAECSDTLLNKAPCALVMKLFNPDGCS